MGLTGDAPVGGAYRTCAVLQSVVHHRACAILQSVVHHGACAVLHAVGGASPCMCCPPCSRWCITVHVLSSSRWCIPCMCYLEGGTYRACAILQLVVITVHALSSSRWCKPCMCSTPVLHCTKLL